MKSVSRWEVGSSFPLVLQDGPGWTAPPGPLRLYGSGRQALRAVVEFGLREHGWKTLHLPEYYCPEVVDAVADLLPVRRYDAGPTGAASQPEAGPSDAVVAVSYFGDPPAVRGSAAGTLIVDATHDPLAPWLAEHRADYVFAALRKTMPLPDGGALWTGNGRDLPPSVTPDSSHLLATGSILAGMCLKAAYLAGVGVAKESYLALYEAGEDAIRRGAVSGISEYSRQALRILPVVRLRLQRLENGRALATGLRHLDGLDARAHPFGVVLRFDSARRRETVRRSLIAQNVYPAVLWTLSPGDAPPRHIEYSLRMLFLHTDFRWDRSDMARVAELVREANTTAWTGADASPTATVIPSTSARPAVPVGRTERDPDVERPSGRPATHAGR